MVSFSDLAPNLASGTTAGSSQASQECLSLAFDIGGFQMEKSEKCHSSVTFSQALMAEKRHTSCAKPSSLSSRTTYGRTASAGAGWARGKGPHGSPCSPSPANASP
jgi:hypothetical protein